MVDAGLPEDFVRQYGERSATAAAFSVSLSHLFDGVLKQDDLKFHSISSRVKSLKSTAEKIERHTHLDALEDVLDLLGFRIITYFPDEVDRVAAMIEAEFDPLPEHSVDKRKLLSPDRFGYLSVHYVVRLRDDRAALGEYSQWAGFPFEVQVRSLLQHAWAEIEHDLGYKVPEAIPSHLRRRFSRLAGLLEIADDEFLSLRTDCSDYISTARRADVSQAATTGINRDSVLRLITDGATKALDEHIAGLVGAPMRDPTRSDAADRARELTAAGFETIGEVVRFLQDGHQLVQRFTSEWIRGLPPMTRVPRGIALFYLAYVHVARSGEVHHVVDYLAAAEVLSRYASRDALAERVLAAARRVSE